MALEDRLNEVFSDMNQDGTVDAEQLEKVYIELEIEAGSNGELDNGNG